MADARDDDGPPDDVPPGAPPRERAEGEPDLEATPELSLPRRPDGDRLARAVARAKIASSLFAADDQVTIGRYRLLELVGRGGMGVVWGAWDPKLERRVAIKLVKTQLEAARERILLEGQALAKLSHPNVVPVFDVGMYEEQVYLVMEWVRGKNLRAYCSEPRTTREILHVYRQAGAGLAAAHLAGLIHRDFKPDNAIVGDDDRVRVLDFGLVRERDTGDEAAAEDGEAMRGAGTPRYMPPEQAAGGALTAAVDQYAFCVSLREALRGRHADDKPAEIPRWLGELVARGTNTDPAQRFPSMQGLLAALDRDPATVWRRRAVVGGAAGLVVAAFAFGRSASEVATCTGGRDEIAALTGAAALSGLSAHLGTLGPFATSEAQRTTTHLREYGERWAQAHRASCLASQRREVPPAMRDRQASCLIRGKAALATIVDVLGVVREPELPDALRAARELPSIERCLTTAASSVVAPPSPMQAAAVAELTRQLEDVRMLGLAARPQAAAAAERVVDAARALGYPPTLAQALLSQQIVRVSQKSLPDAPVPDHNEATRLALQIGDDALAVETYARELYVRSREGSFADRDTTALVEALALRLGPVGRFQHALLLNNIAAAALASGDRSTAATYFRRALDEARLDTSDSVELAYLPSNLALTVDDEQEADALFSEGLSRITRLLGPHHPGALAAQTTVAMFTANADMAQSRARTTCDRYLTYHPHLQQEVVDCAYLLAWLADGRGDSAEAVRWMQIAARTSTDEAKIARAYVRVAEKDRAVVEELDAMAQELRASPTWWRRTWASDAGLLAGRGWSQRGESARARASLETALAVIEETNQIQANSFHRRRLARVRAELALVVAASAPVRARSLAEEALSWYQRAGGYDAIVARLLPVLER